MFDWVFINQNPKISTLNSFVHSSTLKHSKLKDFSIVVYCLIFHNNSLTLMFLTRSEDLSRLCLDGIKSDRNVNCLFRQEILNILHFKHYNLNIYYSIFIEFYQRFISLMTPVISFPLTHFKFSKYRVSSLIFVI